MLFLTSSLCLKLLLKNMLLSNSLDISFVLSIFLRESEIFLSVACLLKIALIES